MPRLKDESDVIGEASRYRYQGQYQLAHTVLHKAGQENDSDLLRRKTAYTMGAVSHTPAVKRKHGIRKSVGGLERQRMAAFDHPMLVAVGKHVGMMGCAARFQRIMSAIQRYGGHTDFRHFRQALLKML